MDENPYQAPAEIGKADQRGGETADLTSFDWLLIGIVVTGSVVLSGMAAFTY